MNYKRIRFCTCEIVLAVFLGVVLAGHAGAFIGLAYLVVLGIIGYNVSEILDAVYFHHMDKLLQKVG